MEVNNLGFNVYRQSGGERVKINPSLIAGSALMVGSDVSLKSGFSYAWKDDAVDASASYWLEDIDLNGTGAWHGPFGVTIGSNQNAGPRSMMLSELTNSATLQKNATIQRGYVANGGNSTGSNVVGGSTSSQLITNGRTPTKSAPVSAALKKQWQLAGQSAIKIAVNKTGWYQVNLTDLMTAGFNPDVDPDSLQMFVGGVEVPIKINSKGSFASLVQRFD